MSCTIFLSLLIDNRSACFKLFRKGIRNVICFGGYYHGTFGFINTFYYKIDRL